MVSCILRPLKNAGTWRGPFEPSVRCAFSRNENLPPDTESHPHTIGASRIGNVTIFPQTPLFPLVR